MTAILVVAAALAFQQTPTPAPAAPAAPAAPRPAQPARRLAPAVLQVKVTDRTGAPIEGAHVSAEGPVSRDGETDAEGAVQFRSLGNGTYRIRAEHEDSVTLEKEVAVRAGAPTNVELALTAAPPPPPPPEPEPEPEPVASAPVAPPGPPRVLSVANLAEESLGGRDPHRFVPIGCSGLDNAQLLVLRESLTTPAKDTIDQFLYVVAGAATLTLAGRDQVVSGGWFAVVPRGMPHKLTRTGRNPAIVLTIVGGEPCAAQGSR
ncbi:MAG: carboxypeptidase regulatory-like domain-containing protein [Vicinamibacterales bacterium]